MWHNYNVINTKDARFFLQKTRQAFRNETIKRENHLQT